MNNKELKETIREVVEYLADEEQNFFENCECIETELYDFKSCKCESNKSHIWRNAVKLKEWLKQK